MTDAADRYRLRLRELLHNAGVSQVTLCKRLETRTGEPWRVSRLSKIMNGHIAWRVDDLVLMAEEGGISLVDLFREPGREFVADATPSELKIIHAMRDYPSIMDHVTGIIRALTPEKRRPSRTIVRERMRLARRDA